MITRTYLRRRGRISKGQARALDELSGTFVIAPQQADSPLPDWTKIFDRKAPLGLEIGFGMGHALLDWGRRSPDWNLLGIDVYQPGIGSLLLGIQAQNQLHMRVIDTEALGALDEFFEPASLDEVRIYFPDPWPKKRHHKRRLIQPGFAALLADRMKSGGMLLLASDWQPYAAWMLDVLDRESELENQAGVGCFAQCSSDRPETNFEARGRSLGHRVWNLAFKRL